MSTHPLAEIFGHRFDNHSVLAESHRSGEICPFHNRVAKCTKSSVEQPLGVCSVFDGSTPVITCPVRFTEDWLFLNEARAFLLPNTNLQWVAVGEVKLEDSNGGAAGNVDYILATLDEHGEVVDFGAVEVQAVYISGNVRRPFEKYMSARPNHDFLWKKPVRPDYVSSSRKRLLPQLLYKGEILRSWGARTAVILQDTFFATLPQLDEVAPHEADIAWYTFRLELDPVVNEYRLVRDRVIFTQARSTLERMTHTSAGDVNVFKRRIKDALDDRSISLHTIDELVIDGVPDDDSEFGELDED